MKPTPSASLPSSERTGRPSGDLRRRPDCRLCASRRVERVLELAPTPPANEFVTAAERGKPQDRFPLDVFQCRDCGHVQLLDIVNPERLFRNYVYVSGTSPVFVEHFRRYAEAVMTLAGSSAAGPAQDASVCAVPGSIIDIGSNDGTLLRFFKDAEYHVLGIDPAKAIAKQATQQGILTQAEFFGPTLARRLREEGWRPTVITANNVYAHADDLGGIADGIAHLLADNGLFVFEVSYLLDVVEKTLFDTIYHEHLSYHSVKPLIGFFRRHGLELVDAQRVEPHGGSLRCIVQRAGGPRRMQPSVSELIALEDMRGLYAPATYQALAVRIAALRDALGAQLRALKAEGKRIAGFGAPAKATTLMYQFAIGRDLIDYIMDDSPWKQGRYSPGLHIPVVPSSHLYDPAHRPDAVVVLAWNFADSIIKKHEAFTKAGGRFIVPLPELKVV